MDVIGSPVLISAACVVLNMQTAVVSLHHRTYLYWNN